MTGAMTDPVVVGIDGTGRSLRALMWAAHDVALRGCSLRMVHALPRWVGDIPFYPPGRFEAAEARGHEIVDEAASLIHDTYPDLHVTVDLPMTTPTAALLERSEHAQEVVVGAKGVDIGNVLLGSTALQLVGHAASPVVVVTHVSSGHQQIAVGTDGSPTSDAALGYAFHEASLRNSRLNVVSGLELPQGWPTHLLRPLPPDDDEVAKRRQEVENQLMPWRDAYPRVEVIEDVHRIGPVHALAEASQRADLLVLGSRGRGGFHGLALGSVTHKLLHYTACTTAVIPHNDGG